MTVCNMSIEAGARAGTGRPGRHHVRLPGGPPAQPTGPPWEAAVEDWRSLVTDDGRRLRPGGRASTPTDLDPVCDLGHQPRPGRPRSAVGFPIRTQFERPRGARGGRRALAYMGLDGRAPRCGTSPSTPSSSGRAPTAASRTCARRPAVLEAGGSAPAVRALVVPGSGQVKAQAEAEGLDQVFASAGLRMAQPGLLDVPGHEPRQARPRRAGRFDLEPQLRGPPGPRRAHPPGVAGRGRGHGRRRPFRHPGRSRRHGGN